MTLCKYCLTKNVLIGSTRCRDCNLFVCYYCSINNISQDLCNECSAKYAKKLWKLNKLKRENLLLKQKIIELELNPPPLGGNLFLDTKKHFESLHQK